MAVLPFMIKSRCFPQLLFPQETEAQRVLTKGGRLEVLLKGLF